VTDLAARAQEIELDPLEVHTGILLNQRRTPAQSEPDRFDGRTPEQVLEDILVTALPRTPCLVAYSGGRDSSALLAAATHVARSHGLADPVPVTFRFPHHPRTHETSWQELTVRHLGLSHWVILDSNVEFDVIGPAARATLSRHGLYWPPNAHNLLPLMRRAAGGSLLTGNGGDELFSPWLWLRVARLRRGRILPTRTDLKPLALSFLPRAGRRVAYGRLSGFGPPWLTEEAARALRRRFGTELRFAGSWRAELELYLSSRFREVAADTFRRFAEDAGTTLVEPFLEARYVRAVGHHAPREGFKSRTEAMQVHFGKLLPGRVLQRSDKAVFTEVSAGASSRAFAETWDGSVVDPSIADANVVRSVWKSERPSMQSLTMLQAAYLADAA
jgi:asparagine synthase (glutamine-hydrolysing)